MSEHLNTGNILLIGFMGTGKSTVARTLHRLYGFQIMEMDETIEKREHMPVSRIFETKGEAYFRDLETKLLTEIQSRNGLVVSCGGGVPLREENVTEMKKNGTVFLLTASAETIYERVRHSHNRPLLESNMTVSYISQLMEQRRDRYESAADVILDVTGKTARELAQEIIACIQQDT